jgi:hypothetical protein
MGAQVCVRVCIGVHACILCRCGVKAGSCSHASVPHDGRGSRFHVGVSKGCRYTTHLHDCMAVGPLASAHSLSSSPAALPCAAQTSAKASVPASDLPRHHSLLLLCCWATALQTGCTIATGVKQWSSWQPLSVRAPSHTCWVVCLACRELLQSPTVERTCLEK